MALTVAVAGCFGPPNSTPVGSGTCDTCKAHPDAGTPARPDAGSPDAGFPDAGPPDAGPPDAGAADGGQADAGPPDSGLPTTVCPMGAIPFPGKVEDLCQSEAMGTLIPLDGVQVSTLAPYSTTVSSDGGQYVACIPPNVPTTLVYQAAGYETSYTAEIEVATPPPSGNIELLTSMVCTAGVQNYFQEVPAFNSNLNAVYVAMVAVSGDSAPCDDSDAGLAGWSFTATLVDGGIGDGGPWPTAYIDTTWTLEAVGATFSTGQALIYNIDPGVEYVAIHGTNPQIGSECPPLNTALGFTGIGYVAPGAFDFFPWIIP